MAYRKVCTMEKDDLKFEVRLYDFGACGNCTLCPFFHPNFCTRMCEVFANDFNINANRTYLVKL